MIDKEISNLCIKSYLPVSNELGLLYLVVLHVCLLVSRLQTYVLQVHICRCITSMGIVLTDDNFKNIP